MLRLRLLAALAFSLLFTSSVSAQLVSGNAFLQGNFTLEVFLQYAQEMNIFVYDVSGKILDRRMVNLPEGKNWVDFTTEKFGAGIIILRYTLDDRVIAERVVIL